MTSNECVFMACIIGAENCTAPQKKNHILDELQHFEQFRVKKRHI